MERTVEQPIIADTSALVSLVTKTDHNHVPATKAAAELREAQRPIILASDVLVETVNTLGKRSSYETALKAVDALVKPGSQFILVETTSHLEAAVAKFKELPQKGGVVLLPYGNQALGAQGLSRVCIGSSRYKTAYHGACEPRRAHSRTDRTTPLPSPFLIYETL